jgi:hypothetical protein
MKRLKIALFALLAGVGLLGIAASISNLNPVPQTWGTPNGTNAFGLNAAAVPVVTIAGTNYTGVSTNYAVTNVSTLVIKNGLIVGVQ